MTQHLSGRRNCGGLVRALAIAVMMTIALVAVCRAVDLTQHAAGSIDPATSEVIMSMEIDSTTAKPVLSSRNNHQHREFSTNDAAPRVPIGTSQPVVMVSPFVRDLLDRMSVKEKIGQLTQLDIQMIVNKDGVTLNETKLIEAMQQYGVGSYLNSPFFGGPLDGMSGYTPQQWVAMVNRAQEIALKYSNSSIPILWGLDSVHGANYVHGAVMFPHNLGLAASFNTTTTRIVREVATKDTRAVGIAWNFDPVADLGVNPLWPRLYETFGEDPLLVSQMVRESIHAIQGDDLSAPNKCACSLKHYVGYSDPKNGKDRSNAWIDMRQLYQYFLPSFRAGVEAGAETIMVNSGSINGIPVHSSRELLHDVLRGQLGFTGIAVTDYYDIQKLTYYHKVAPTFSDGIKMALDAGIDMSMVPLDYTFSTLLEELFHRGQITAERIDQSAARILQLKYDLGLFENPFADASSPLVKSIGSKSDRDAAVEIARDTIVLLKNDRHVLPLPNGTTTAAAPRRVLVIGPCAHSLSCLSGGWSIHWQGAEDIEFPYGRTIYTAVHELLERTGANATVEYIHGANFTHLTDAPSAIARAASRADVVILAVGEPPEAETPGDIDDLALSESQRTLYDIVISHTSAPIVTVMVSARPRLFGKLADGSSAMLMAFLPGPDGGQAIADVLFGVVNPSAKLPITYPRTSGDINVPYYHPHTSITNPLFPFGHGLSYTDFQYSDLTLSTATLRIGEPLSVSITVANTGTLEGKESILLYVSDVYASVCPEVKMLKAFHKQSIAAGESITHTFVLSPEAFSFIGRNNVPVIEAGEFIIRCGDQQAHFQMIE